MRALVFGSSPAPGTVLGTRIDLPIDWAELRFASLFIGVAWLVLSSYALVPSITRWVGKRSIVVDKRWLFVSLLSIGALSLVSMVVLRYRRAAGVVLTSEGIWTPAWRGGRFLPWAQVVDARLKDYGRGATDIELRYPDGRFGLTPGHSQIPTLSVVSFVLTSGMELERRCQPRGRSEYGAAA